MEVSSAYLPQETFAPSDRGGGPVPRVFISPQRYIQGRGVLRGVGRYLSLMRATRVALLMSERGSRSDGVRLLDGLRAAGIEAVVSTFRGECSLEEITGHVERLSTERIDCVIAAGGGKCIDAGKAVAFRLGTPVVVVPTLASNDAPCSALSILYSPEGISAGVEFYPNSPAIVVVDTDIIAAAPERYLVAGMGDAMATWYEARVCLLNQAGITTIGARPTLASCAIGEVCAQTLYKEGRAAAAAVAAGTVNDSLETVVEANTLLSGLGFESGGLAAAHGVAQSYTAIPKVHAKYLHGEMVAMGTLAQLMMESRPDEAGQPESPSSSGPSVCRSTLVSSPSMPATRVRSTWSARARWRSPSLATCRCRSLRSSCDRRFSTLTAWGCPWPRSRETQPTDAYTTADGGAPRPTAQRDAPGSVGTALVPPADGRLTVRLPIRFSLNRRTVSGSTIPPLGLRK
jgi:glycerol dehydrogenase